MASVATKGSALVASKLSMIIYNYPLQMKPRRFILHNHKFTVLVLHNY